MGSFAILRRCISRSRSRSRSTIFRSPCVYHNSAGSFRSLNSATNQGSSLDISISPSGSRPRLIQFGDGDGEVVGCSHGWVAVFNKRNNNLSLSNPLSHEEIKLPPIHTLPDPEFNLDLDGQGSVSKLILSSSPRDDECRAMMTFGPANRLAFCLPAHSAEWTPIGDHFFEFDHNYPFESVAKVHEDLVYCTRRKVFTSITAAHLNLRPLKFNHAETGFTSERCDWDVQDPDSPKLVRSERLLCCEDVEDDEGKNVRGWLDDNIELLEKECIQIPHLVYLEEYDQLFVAVQFVRLIKEGGGSPLGFVPSCELKGLSGVFPGKTFGFVVMDVNDEEEVEGEGEKEKGDLRHCWLMGDLSGLSMFVGINPSFAISEDDGELINVNPNSIYFTDSKRLKRVCGVNDNGIFDYETKTISDYHHLPIQSFNNFKASSSPFWFI